LRRNNSSAKKGPREQVGTANKDQVKSCNMKVAVCR